MIPTILFALVSAAGYGFVNITTKQLTQSFSPLFSMFLRYIAILLFYIPLFLIIHPQFAGFNVQQIGIILLLAAGSFVAINLIFYALQNTKVGLVASIYNLNAVIGIFIAVLVFSEVLSLFQYIALSLTLVGTTLVTFDRRELQEIDQKHIKGLSAAFGCALFFGLVFSFFRIPISYYGVYWSSLLGDLTVMLYIIFFVLISKQRRSEITKVSKKHLPIIISAAFLSFIGFLFQGFSFQYEFVSIAQAVSTSSALFSIGGAFFIFKERLTIQQYIGSMITIISVGSLFVI